MVRVAEPADFEVALSRTDGETDTWLYLGDGPTESVEISVESARRLLDAAEAKLGA